MFKGILCMSAALAFGGTALAEEGALDPRVAATIGNTLIYETRDGSFLMYLHTDADGTYRAEAKRTGAGDPGNWVAMSGTWRIEGELNCRYQTTPPPPHGRPKICEPLANLPGIGSESSAMNGMMKISLIKGDVPHP